MFFYRNAKFFLNHDDTSCTKKRTSESYLEGLWVFKAPNNGSMD